LHRSQPRSNKIIATERKFLHRSSVGCWHAQNFKEWQEDR